MLLKDVKAGEVYAAVAYYDRRVHSAVEVVGRLEANEWETAYSSLHPVLVVETRVPVPGYSRPGVLARTLDRQTLEPFEGERGEPRAMQAVRVLLPWAEWDRRYHEHVETMREEAERRRVAQERAKEKAQEKAAHDWMEREFARAGAALADVCAVLKDDEDALADVANFPTGDVTDELRDRVVRAIVKRRFPDGNPYLNGTYEAR